MIETDGLRLSMTSHARMTIADKGFDRYAIMDTFHRPECSTEVRKYPGQVRLIGNGLALVGKVVQDMFILITVYEDGTLTPPRPDQMGTPEGRRYANRYARGLGRG